MRGEEHWRQQAWGKKWELPPHARRRVFSRRAKSSSRGITSACAEKRMHSVRLIRLWWNYLRMRGEERRIFPGRSWSKELPPHARRRAGCSAVKPNCLGITSACAEKRAVLSAVFRAPWNYLRMRGEESSWAAISGNSLELPPHARRRGVITVFRFEVCGITSACAEKRQDG